MQRIDLKVMGLFFLAAFILGIASLGYGYEAKTQLNINTATIEELNEVPGIDMDLAQNIVSYRDANGPFSAVDDLLKVKGMDEKRLEEVRMHLSVATQPTLEW